MYSNNTVPAATSTKKSLQKLSRGGFSDLLTTFDRRVGVVKKTTEKSEIEWTVEDVGNLIFQSYAGSRDDQSPDLHDALWCRGDDCMVSADHWMIMIKLARVLSMKDDEDRADEEDDRAQWESSMEGIGELQTQAKELTAARENFRKMVSFIIRLSSACSIENLLLGETLVLVYRWMEVGDIDQELRDTGLSREKFEKEMPAAANLAVMWRDEVAHMEEDKRAEKKENVNGEEKAQGEEDIEGQEDAEGEEDVDGKEKDQGEEDTEGQEDAEGEDE